MGKEKRKGVFVSINNLSDRFKRAKSASWRKAQRECRQRKANISALAPPPMSPDERAVPISLPGTSRQAAAGRKHVLRKKAACYRKLFQNKSRAG